MKRSFLYPGQYFVVDEPTIIATVLGSCISVILYSRKSPIAGMCHYLLAEEKQGAGQTPRYGSYAIPKMLDDMVRKGIKIPDLEAQIIGGASVVSALSKVGGGVGANNIAIAEKLLQQLGVRVVHSDTGGSFGRKVFFDTQSKKVEVKQLADDAGVATAGSSAPVRKQVKVLIIDDSATARTVFSKALAQSRDIRVVGQAIDPYEAREKIVKLKPDVITLDIEMPRMNGVEFLAKLMKHHPLPVIMVSSLGATGIAAQKSLALGAVEFVQKPSQFDPAALRKLGDELIPKVVAAANVSLSKLMATRKSQGRSMPAQQAVVGGSRQEKVHCICVGGNTGGVPSLEVLLAGLAQDTPPVVVAMSTIAPVIKEFIDATKAKSRVNLVVVEDEAFFTDGFVYFAPPGHHIVIEKAGDKYKARAVADAAQFGQRPSFDRLLASAMSCVPVAGIVGVLLSGFGSDGCKALTKVREGGGVSIVESPETAGCALMPSEAIEMGAAEHIVQPDGISDIIMTVRNMYAA